jgi:hypothetical protein
LNDTYIGSGKYLKYAIEKYGIENFSKEILFIFDTPEQMYDMEAKLVNEEFISEHNTYNLKIGGFGGFDYINSNPEKYLTPKRLAALMPVNETRVMLWVKYRADSDFKRRWQEQSKQKLAKAREAFPAPFRGRTHSDVTKQIISEKAKARALADPRSNSQYGTVWVTDGKYNKKIGMGDLVPVGWSRGRVLKRAV